MDSEYQHKVLVVDDDEQIGKTICRILKTEHRKYAWTDSGEAALEKLKKARQPYSLIISDQRMGGMDGTTFLEQAKNISPNTIRFLLTGYMEMETLIKAVNKGAIQRYIAKPWDPDEFVEDIRSGISL